MLGNVLWDRQSKRDMYEVLPTWNKSFRVLRVSQIALSRHDSGLSIRFDTITPNAGHVYRALSYTWGEASSSDPIIYVETKGGGRAHLRIRRNLSNFLWRYVKHEGPQAGPLFIDALCIDQQDISEKNQQVTMMDKIFEGATTVIAWLGEADQDCCRLFEQLERSDRRRSRLGASLHRTLLGRDLNRVASNADLQRYWQNVSTRPFFSRTWIVQEIGLARDIAVWCGPYAVSWEAFSSGPCSVEAYSDANTHNSLPDGIENLVGIRRERRSKQGVGQRLLTLQDLCYRTSSTGCSIMLDKLYAVRSLEELEVEQIPIPVDYNTNVASAFVWLWVHRAPSFRVSLYPQRGTHTKLVITDGDLDFEDPGFSHTVPIILRSMNFGPADYVQMLRLCQRLLRDEITTMLNVMSERGQLPVWHEGRCWHALVHQIIWISAVAIEDNARSRLLNDADWSYISRGKLHPLAVPDESISLPATKGLVDRLEQHFRAQLNCKRVVGECHKPNLPHWWGATQADRRLRLQYARRKFEATNRTNPHVSLLMQSILKEYMSEPPRALAGILNKALRFETKVNKPIERCALMDGYVPLLWEGGMEAFTWYSQAQPEYLDIICNMWDGEQEINLHTQTEHRPEDVHTQAEHRPEEDARCLVQ